MRFHFFSVYIWDFVRMICAIILDPYLMDILYIFGSAKQTFMVFFN